jgi:hypothetical protein
MNHNAFRQARVASARPFVAEIVPRASLALAFAFVAAITCGLV